MTFSQLNDYKGRVLVVDDQRANLDAARILLETQGYVIRCEVTGDHAIDAYAEFRPDLILLDMHVPGHDGFAVMEKLSALHGENLAPVVCVTSAHDELTLEHAFAAGAVDVVARPYVGRELLARVNAHLGLKLASDRLRRTANDWQELVNLVAHDLKNPLSSVLFASQMLRESQITPDRVPRYLDIIHESATDAVGYIRDYLESQAPSARQAMIQDAECDLRDVLTWTANRYTEMLEQHGISLTLQIPSEPAQVRFDPRVARQVVENLMTNVIKYAPNAPVELSVRQGAPGYWRLAVADTGPGLDAHQQRQLFTPFTRLHASFANDQMEMLSSGLGLSLAKRTVEQRGGQLWYEANIPRGSTFLIELPVVP